MVILSPGMQLGPYELVAPLGSGGMGEIFRARDSRLGREIAIKVLPHHLREDPMALARFQREAKAIAAISHPNILAIHDVGTDSGVFYAVTELLEGRTLRERIGGNPLPWREAIDLAAGIAEGLAAAHDRGVIHRDLKPENIFLTRDGRVKILDFGLAHTGDEAQPEEDPTTDVMTTPGAIVGTVGYMSPEQLRSQTVGPASDVFSLGCVLFEMITGRRPFQRNTSIDTMAAILQEEPDPEALEKSGTPPDVEQILYTCLSKTAEQRYGSARELAADLRAMLSGSGIIAASPLPFKPVSKRRRGAIDSIAILPFVNATGDPEADYLSDGITESIISTLSHLPRLRVMASSTVFRYKGQPIDALAAGRALNVRAVLAGRLMQVGDRTLIRTELVDVSDGAQIWGEQYNRRSTDLLELQQEIAGEISEKLRIRISGEARKRLRKKPTRSDEAYRLYLKGRFQWSKRTIEGLRRGIEEFDQAIQVDPGFALAWVGIADSYITLGTNVPLAPREAVPKAREAALRALELDPDLAEAHASLAAVRWWHDWNRIEAEQEFRTALSLNPNYAVAHDAYGILLAEMQEMDAANEHLRRAQEIDPLSLIISTHVAFPFLFSGRVEEAIEQLQLTLDMDPDFIPALGWLGLAWERRGKFDQAIEVFERALAINDIPIVRASLAHTRASTGDTTAARADLASLIQQKERRYVSPYDIAVVHSGLREIDQAFDWLERAIDDRSAWMVFLRVDQRLDPLRGDPRFADILRRSGIESSQV